MDIDLTTLDKSNHDSKISSEQNMERCFVRIDSFLSKLSSPVSNGDSNGTINVNSSIFFSEVIEEMKEFIDKLTDINAQQELDNLEMMVDDGDNGGNKVRMISQYLSRLKAHVRVLEQMKSATSSNSTLQPANSHCLDDTTSTKESLNLPTKRKLPNVSQLSVNSQDCTNSQLTVRNLKRWFALIDSFLKRPLETINSVQYFLDQIGEARGYTTRLNELVERDDVEDGHFMMIKLYLERLQMHVVELDRAKLKHIQLNKMKFTCDSAKLLDNLRPYDGNILHWTMFWSSYESLIASMDEPQSKFRLLYNNIDTESRIRFLADIDPDHPNLELVFARIESHFEDSGKMLLLVKLQLNKLKRLKHRYSKQSWLTLMEAAKLAKITLDKLNRGLVEEEEVVKMLLDKLPPKYSKLYRDNFWIRFQRNSADDFVALCELHISMIDQRMSLGLPTLDIEIPSELCLFCQADYHYPEQCDLSLEQRRQVIRQKGRCRRCLVEEFERGHNCGERCSHCHQHNHHLALCANYRVDSDTI